MQSGNVSVKLASVVWDEVWFQQMLDHVSREVYRTRCMSTSKSIRKCTHQTVNFIGWNLVPKLGKWHHLHACLFLIISGKTTISGYLLLQNTYCHQSVDSPLGPASPPVLMATVLMDCLKFMSSLSLVPGFDKGDCNLARGMVHQKWTK